MVRGKHTDSPHNISVVIPSYNYAGYISKAIDSVLTQQVECEIIITDDGSTDNTRDVVTGYGDDVRYIYQDNAGVSAARNHGASIASGDYIIFLDSDDRLLPGVLQLFKEQVERYPDVDCFIAGRTTINENSKPKTSVPDDLSGSCIDNFKAFLRRKMGSVTLGCIKRSVFQMVNFPEAIKNNEDIVFTAHVFARFNCHSIQAPIIEVHKHDDSLRHHAHSTIESSLTIVNELFNPEVLPGSFMKFRSEYFSRVLLSRFRALYLAGEKTAARKLYHEAISQYPPNLFIISYLKKYLRTWF